MVDTWHIRDATEDDLDALADVFRRASLSNPSGGDLLRAHPEVLELDPAPVRAGRTRAVVEGNHVIGFASTRDGNGWLELDDLFVDPDRQGEGFGLTLVADAVATARAAGLDRIQVTGNADALGFYRRAGFHEIGEVDTPLGVMAARLQLRLGG